MGYNQDVGSHVVPLLETKLLVNSVVLDARNGTRFLSCDLKENFLASPISRPEYMRILYEYIPTDIRQTYKLDKQVSSGEYLYIKFKKLFID